MKGRIVKIISDKNITKSKFAETLNVSPAFISQVCAGTSKPSDRTIKDICRIYGVNELWLCTGEGEPYAVPPRRDEMTELFNTLMNSSPDAFRTRVVESSLRLLRYGEGSDEWKLLEKIYNSIVEDVKKETDP